MEKNKGGYRLNPNVKTATPALLKAASIGVMVYDNPQKASEENKDAILVVCFGTSVANARQNSLQAIANSIAAAHPDVTVLLCFTSRTLPGIIKKNEGIDTLTLPQALEALADKGYNRVAMATLELIPAIEYDKTRAIFDEYKLRFKKLTLGTSLLYWMGQENQPDDTAGFVKTLSSLLPRPQADEAVLLMAHGTLHPSNAYYAVLQNRMENILQGNYFLYTLHGRPVLGDVIEQLKKRGVRRLQLLPLLVVAGKHALRDMAGDGSYTHESILRKAGFDVGVSLHGLGENKEVQALFMQKAEEAWGELQRDPSAEPVSSGMRH